MIVRRVFSILIFFTVIAFQGILACDDIGSSTFWEFDQVKLKFKLEKVSSSKVCHFIKEQKSFNLLIKYFNEKEEVFEQKVFWSEFSSQEEVLEEKMTNRRFKTKDYKILKIPVLFTEVSRFEVYSFKGKLLSKGWVGR